MTDTERREAEIRSIMKMAGVKEKKEPKKPAKKQTKGADK